jgi:hypothetical protein
MTKSKTGHSGSTETRLVKPGPAHQRLDVFHGTWSAEGKQYESSFGPAAKLTAVDTYEWLQGGLFLVHRFQGRSGDADMACVEIIGVDPSGSGYRMHAFYNDGRINQWQLNERDGSWTISGTWDAAGPPVHVRCTIVFKDSGNTRTGKWERSSNGSDWTTFLDVAAKKHR